MENSKQASSSKLGQIWPFNRSPKSSGSQQPPSKHAKRTTAVVPVPQGPRPRPSRDMRPARPISLLLPAPLLIPPTAPLPPLPFELWDGIFSMAAEEHILKEFFSIPGDAPFTGKRVSDYQLEYVYLQSAATMRSCARVNREWSDHATRYLYRYIWLRSASDAELLARTLAPSLRRSTRTGLLQQLVQNLLVRFPKSTPDARQKSRSYSRKLSAVLRNLPNLTVFLHGDGSDASLPKKVCKALTYVPLLSRGEWTTTAHKTMLSSDAMRSLLSLYLQCPGLAPAHVDPTPMLAVELPHLHTLSIPFCRHKALSAAALGKWHMPALRYLSVCRCSVLGASFGPSATDMPLLLRHVGANLDQLELNCAMAGIALDLAKTCPLLRTLLVSALSLPKVASHPALELVGLHQPIGFAPPPAEMDALISLLDALQQGELFPCIQHVRYLIPAQAVTRLSAHPDSGLRAAIESAVAAGILVEDVGCNPIKFSHASSVAPSDYDWDGMSVL